MSTDSAHPAPSASEGIEIIRVARPMRYRDAYRAQVHRRDAVIDGAKPEALFLLEHLPVITLGRNAHEGNILCEEAELTRLGIELHATDRGGDVSYHGPGQAVAYPVLDLRRYGLSIRGYLRFLEQVVIDVLADYGLAGERLLGFTGVWVGGGKVSALGVGARRWVTHHGLALNVDPDMDHFSRIIPCGITDKPVTSLRALLGDPPPMDEVMERLQRHFLSALPARKEDNPATKQT